MFHGIHGKIDKYCESFNVYMEKFTGPSGLGEEGTEVDAGEVLEEAEVE